MTILRFDFWADLLWDHYSKIIMPGEAFYLSADGDMMHDLVKQRQADITREEALQDFHHACQALIEIKPSKSLVKEIAFENIPGKIYSRVICLAVQQVLVVEQMLNDEHYSANSYFPRYRECLGLSNDILRPYTQKDPLKSGTFEKIWKKLESELALVAGFEPSTITFSLGTGKDKKRKLPLSQALFTTQDLNDIVKRSEDLKKDSSEQFIFNSICDANAYLGRRGRKLIDMAKKNKLICDLLCKQVKAFLYRELQVEAFLQHGLEQETSTKERGKRVVAFCCEDFDDLFDDELLEDKFDVYLKSDIGQEEGKVLEDFLRKSIRYNKALLLILRNEQYEETKEFPVEGDSVLILLTKEQEPAFLNQFSGIFKLCKSNLPDPYVLFFCSAIQNAYISTISKMCSLSSASEPKIELLGGLLADARSRIFLAGYPPRSIRYRGTELLNETSIVVNDSKMQVGAFLQSISYQQDSSSYIVQIKEDSTKFDISPSKFSNENLLVGFQLESGEFSPIAKNLDEKFSGLCGTTIVIEEQIEKTQNVDIADKDILMLAKKGKRIAVSDSDLSLVLEMLSRVRGNKQFTEFASHQIRKTRSLPLDFVTRGFLGKLKACNC